MPSIIEVDTIKNKTGTQNTVLSTDGSGNVTIANSTFNGAIASSATGTFSGTIGSNATFPAGHVIQTTKQGSSSASGHVTTTSSSLVDVGISVDPPVTKSSSNYMRITFASSGHLYQNQGIEIRLYVSYNGGSYAVLGTDLAHYQKHNEYSLGLYTNFDKTWIDTNTSNLNTGSGATYKIYCNRIGTNSTTLYVIHNTLPWLFMAEEVQG